jgi:ribosome-binding factor A
MTVRRHGLFGRLPGVTGPVLPSNHPLTINARYLMRPFKRSDRLAVQIQRDISQVLETELMDQIPGMVTITQVKLSDDLSYAKVYYSCLGNDSDRVRAEEFLTAERKHIRSLVGRNLRIRHIPEIDFKFDPSIEQGARIEQLLEEIKKERGDKQD